MPSWDSSQYLRFADDRLRPALDLIGRIEVEHPEAIYDLGCGPGNVTRMLARRWPEARIVGIDSSAAMLAKARGAMPDAEFQEAEFQEADIGGWTPAAPPDVIFSNATLQWLPDHQHLLPRLARFMAPGGTLAIQMPRNHGAPSHGAIVATARDGPWRAKLSDVRSILPVASPSEYYRILSPVARHLDIWEAEYLHVLEGDDPVVEWTKGTALQPYLDALGDSECRAFLAAYSSRVGAAYPKEKDGRTLFPFRRIFIVARA